MTYSFVVPNYNNHELLDNCLMCLRVLYPKNTVVVCDDASSEINKVEAVCRKHNAYLKKSTHNNGFGYNCNRGIEACNTDAVILLNNDVVLTEDIISECDRVFSYDDRIGIVGFLLYYPNGLIQHGGIKLETFHKTTHYDHCSEPSEATDALMSRYVMATTGALMVLRKAMTDQIGVFNGGYRLAFEDTELCLRAWSNDWRVYYTANVSAIHKEGYTRGRTPEEKRASRTWEMEQQSYNQYCKDVEHYSYNNIINKMRAV